MCEVPAKQASSCCHVTRTGRLPNDDGRRREVRVLRLHVAVQVGLGATHCGERHERVLRVSVGRLQADLHERVQAAPTPATLLAPRDRCVPRSCVRTCGVDVGGVGEVPRSFWVLREMSWRV